jgi:hypothetical protein
MSTGFDYNEARLYVAVSRVAAQELRLSGSSSGRLENWSANNVRIDDWTLDGCTLDAETPYRANDLIGRTRAWVGCATLRDAKLWTTFAASGRGTAVMYLQLNLPDSEWAGSADEIMSSVVLAEEKISTDSGAADDLVDDFHGRP